ncbi:hypothetical protein, partial [Bradyrhizobium sp. SUTN9-2]|uniref:hypothetical protein n=1 Tax=Bradyrhizobium sp. SUTN9-2 TaxID=1167456 RepID=UPI001305027D
TVLQDAIGGLRDQRYDFSLLRGREALNYAIEGLMAALGNQDVQRKNRYALIQGLSSRDINLAAEYHWLNSSWPTTNDEMHPLVSRLLWVTSNLITTVNRLVDAHPLTFHGDKG